MAKQRTDERESSWKDRSMSLAQSEEWRIKIFFKK